MTASVEYLGNLRTKCTHLPSGSVIHTDAPLDNKGLGQAFSPTDLLATSYASCMLTIIGIFCQEHAMNFEHGKASVVKEMSSGPRRIGKLIIAMDLRGNGWSNEEFERVIRAGKSCPVAHSVSGNIEIEFTFLND
jgi:organic hydroperoxide reductase OsmC/OhrA